MTELERQLLEALKHLESHYMEQKQTFAATLNDLMKQLKSGAERMNALSVQLDVLSQRLEKLQLILAKSRK